MRGFIAFGEEGARTSQVARPGAEPAAASPAWDEPRKLAQAEAVFRTVLERRPDDSDALHLLALAVHGLGRPGEAAALLTSALERDPGHSAYHNDLGLALLDDGRPEEAAQSFRRAVALDPDFVEARANLARTERSLGRLPEAAATYCLALERAPYQADLHVGIGAVLGELGRKDAALRHLRRAIDLEPGGAEAWLRLAQAYEESDDLTAAAEAYRRAAELRPKDVAVLCALGRLSAALERSTEAAGFYQRALRLDPGLAEARLALASLLHVNGYPADAAARYRALLTAPAKDPSLSAERQTPPPRNAPALNGAESSLKRLIALEPDDPDLGLQLGRLLRRQGRLDAAITAYREVTTRCPDCARAHAALGLALVEANRRSEALASFEKAAALEPGSAPVHANLANLRQELGLFDAALDSYGKAIELAPGFANAHYNRAQLLLRLGRYEEGWHEYEWRLAMPASRNLPRPPAGWDRSPPLGRRVALVGEQGPGDAVLFAHCLRELAADARAVTLHLEPRLVPLFARSFPEIRVSATRPDALRAVAGEAPLTLPIGSLPRIYRNSEADFARGPARYLTPDSAKTAAWRARLEALGPGLKVGFSWRGGKSVTERRLRQTVLVDWAALLRVTGIHFVNLQYGERHAELDAARTRAGVAVHDWDDLDPFADLDGLAALIDALDLVVTMANTTAHFAGALAKPVWILVPAAPSWRWQHERTDSPWYRSARLIRQRPDEPWTAFAERLAPELAQAAAAAPSQSAKTRSACP